MWFFLIVVIGCMKAREEMKEKEVKEERGRDGVFNLLSRARGGKKERKCHQCKLEKGER